MFVLVPFVRNEIVNGYFYVLVLEQLEDLLVGQVKVQSIRTVKVIVSSMFVLLLRETFVECIKLNDAAHLTKLLFDYITDACLAACCSARHANEQRFVFQVDLDRWILSCVLKSACLCLAG